VADIPNIFKGQPFCSSVRLLLDGKGSFN